jgi:protein phosphatase
MNITIQKPLSVNEFNVKFGYEDSIYPNNNQATIDNRFFLVCDGVGNSKAKEIAGSLACESIQTYFQNFLDVEKRFDPSFIEKAIRYTGIRFDEYIEENPETKGMAVTFCLLYFSEEGIFLAYSGNSRVYHFRNGKIVFKTKEVDIDIIHITDILPGDQFFMCTNEVTKVLNDYELCNIFSSKNSSKDKLEQIKDLCKYKSKNNYSAYVIPIRHVHKKNSFKQIVASFLFDFA